MYINPVILNKVQFIQSTQNCSKLFTEKKSDTFVKRISFGSQINDNSFEAFSKWAQETHFTDNALNIIDETGSILGDGFEGTTYSIPGNEQWVIKQFKRGNYLQQSLKGPEIKKIKDISPDLNIGQAIASVKIPMNDRFAHHLYVLKKQTGISYGVALSNSDFYTDATSKKHLESLKKMSELPISSYEKLLDDITYINKRGYKIDANNPYNFMVDWENQSVKFVDIADRLDDKKTRQYGDVLFALLDGDFGYNFKFSKRPEQEKIQASISSKRICSKFLSTMIRKHLKFSSTPNLSKVMSTEPFECTIGENRPDKKLEKLAELGLY